MEFDDGTGATARAFTPPPLRVGPLTLRPVLPKDYEFLQAAEFAGELATRWRYRGSTPGPEEWARGLFRGVLAQFLVFSSKERAPLGLVCAYEASHRDGHAKLAAARFTTTPDPFFMMGVGVFLNYLFKHWPLRKLFLETAEYNSAQFDSEFGRRLVQEGRLREYYFLDGRHWDKLILSLSRETVEAEIPALLAALTAGPEDSSPEQDGGVQRASASTIQFRVRPPAPR